MKLKRSEFGDDYKFGLKDPMNLDLPKKFSFIGLVSLIDPPRENVKNAIKKC